ncbi:MAG: alpha/beta hydrolase [Methylacidiphilales bacterium]|nr:alpha/beta hydrolase [Candidatus Methylacidiphilales bacterium]
MVLLVLAAGQMQAHATCDVVSVKLKRGDFSFFRFYFKPDNLAKGTNPKALIVFGSGASGWSGWEDRVGDKLQADGCEVLGIDSAKYALINYDLNDLEADYQTFAQFGLKPYGNHPPPVILGGWSTGAEQSVAIAGGPHPPAGLVGLVLVSPGDAGGYGTHATDYLAMSIPASKRFELADFAPRLGNLRIAQWHAEFDLLDSRTWLAFLKAPHREYDFSNAIHDYRSACDEFLVRLSGSVDWILGKDSEAVASEHAR